MTAIYKRELRSYFTTMTGWVFIAFLLLVSGVLCWALNFIGGYPAFEAALSSISLIFLLLIPLLTMKAWAEEKHLKTDNLLYTLPMKISSVVCGKYFAMVTVFLIPVALMGLIPIVLSLYGTVHLTASYGALLGFFLFGATLIAVGMFMSSLTESQIIAAVLSFIALLVIYLMPTFASLVPSGSYASLIAFTVLVLLFAGIVYLLTKNAAAGFIVAIVLELILYAVFFIRSSLFEGAFARLMCTVSVYDRFGAFVNGMFDLTSVVYDLTVIFLFLFLTVQSVEKRRWS